MKISLSDCGVSGHTATKKVLETSMKTLKSTITAILTVLLLPLFAAAAPNLINYQGRLVNSAGNPLSGSKTITFRICDSLAGACSVTCSAGNSCLWTETQTINLENGIFSVKLGAVTPLTSAVYSADSRYLGVAVDADPEMSPRVQLVSVPFALSAANISSADGVAISTFVAVSGHVQAVKFYGDGSALTGISSSDKVLKAGDTMTGRLTAPDATLTYGIGAATGVFSGAVSAASFSGNIGTSASGVTISTYATVNGHVTAVKYYGDGSALTGVNSNDKVLKAGDTMTGNLTLTGDSKIIAGSSITTTGGFFGSGAGLSNIPAAGIASGSLGSQVLASSVAVGSVQDASIVGVSGSKVSGNITGNAANITGNLPVGQIANGTLGSQVIASSIAVASIYTYSTCTAGQVLKASGGVWACGTDNAGAGSMVTQSGATSVTATGVMNYTSSDFGLTEAPAGQANVTIANKAVTLAKMADLTANTIIGNNTAGSTAPLALTTAQVKALLALDNVNNTTDGNKPVSSAQQTALNAKADLSGATFTGAVNMNNVAINLSGAAGDIVSQSSITTAGNFYGNGSQLTALDAGNIASGALNDGRLSANVTLQGNSFNGASELVKLDGSSKLPAVDGSQLTNIASSQLGGKFYDSQMAISTGAFASLNGADQLVKLASDGKLPAVDGSALTGLTKNQVGLASVTNDAQLKSADLDADAALTANSATKIPAQSAVKSYVDTKDGAVVHLAGAESITGAKTFSVNPVFNAGAIPDSAIASLSLSKVVGVAASTDTVAMARLVGALSSTTTVPSTLVNLSTVAADNLVLHLAGAESITGAKTFSVNPVFNAGAIPDNAIATVSLNKVVGVAASTDTVAMARLVGALSSTTTVPSTLVNLSTVAADNLVLHLAGGESITGAKTFSVNPVFNAGAIPDSAIASLSLSKVIGVAASTDTVTLSRVIGVAASTDTVAMARLVGALSSTTTVPSTLVNLSTVAADNLVIHLAGAENVTGVKTFTASGELVYSVETSSGINVSAGPVNAAFFLGNGGALTGLTKGQVGLGNVTNDAQLPLAGGTMTGKLGLYKRTYAELMAIIPADVGELYFCSDCNPKLMAVSTGTAVGDFSDPAGTSLVNP